MDASNGQRLFELALAHQRSNEHARAAELYREILGRHPRHADAWSNLGISLKMLGDLDGAADAFNRVLALAPDRADAYAFLGHTLRAAGRKTRTSGDVSAEYAGAHCVTLLRFRRLRCGFHAVATALLKRGRQTRRLTRRAVWLVCRGGPARHAQSRSPSKNAVV